jgi:hypothetical protein
MPADSINAVTEAIRCVLGEGLPQDSSVFSYLTSVHGEASPDVFAAVLEDRDSADAAVLAGLLLFPGVETLVRLEPVLEAARCSAEDASAVAEAVEAKGGRTRALLPGGQPVDLSLLPGEARTLVMRLRLEHSPPPELTAVLDKGYPGPAAVRLKVVLRHCRLTWAAPRVNFLEALLEGLSPSLSEPGQVSDDTRGAEAAPEVLAWALSHLGDLPLEADPGQALGARYLQLTARLRRASEFHAALAGSSFEVMSAQGARVALPQPETVRRELALLDSVSQAVTGRPAWSLAGSAEMDLGEFEDGESVIAALGGP